MSTHTVGCGQRSALPIAAHYRSVVASTRSTTQYSEYSEYSKHSGCSARAVPFGSTASVPLGESTARRNPRSDPGCLFVCLFVRLFVCLCDACRRVHGQTGGVLERLLRMVHPEGRKFDRAVRRVRCGATLRAVARVNVRVRVGADGRLRRGAARRRCANRAIGQQVATLTRESCALIAARRADPKLAGTRGQRATRSDATYDAKRGGAT